MSRAIDNKTKANNVVSAREPRFNVKGDGSTNDTVGLQAALDEAIRIKGTLFIPEGRYRFSGLTVSGAVTIQGEGMFRSYLQLVGLVDANGITISAGIDSADINIRDIGLDGIYPGNAAGHGIYLPDESVLSYGRGVHLDNVYITKFAGKGLYVGENRNNGTTKRLSISRCEDGVYIYKSSDWKSLTSEIGIIRQFCINIPDAGADNKFIGGSLWESDEAGINLGTVGSSPNTFIGMTLDHHKKNAIRISGSAGGNQPHLFIGNWFRDNSQIGDNLHSQILLTNTGGATFIGNTFTDQEGNPRPKYLIEFSGSNGKVNWVANTAETDTYATAFTNTPSLLSVSSQSMEVLDWAYLGGVSGSESLAVAPGTASGNRLQVNGSAAGGVPFLSAQGADTNITLRIYGKGTGNVETYVNNLRVSRNLGVSSAVNWIDITNAATTNSPSISANGTDTNVDLALISKGTGVIKFGSHTSSGDAAVSGYITIKDSGGTVRKLAVIT